MNCPNCGHAGQQVGIGQTYECPSCGTVFVDSARPQAPGVSGHAAAAAVADLADVTRLAQVRQRAAQARLEMAEQAAREDASRPRRRLRAAWVAVAFVGVLAATVAGTYLAGAFAPRLATAGTDRDLRALAEAGETGAQFGLGLLYDYGFQGSARNPDEAQRWYLKAAAAGDVDAQYYLGKWYRGRSARPEPADAFYWIRLAAEQGQPSAQAVLGELYETGEGVAKDLEQAGDWYLRAADQGVAQAHCGIARLYAGQQAGYRQDPAAAAMHDYVAKALGRDCALTDYGAGGKLAEWTRKEGERRGKERLAQGFKRRPLR
jgi:TPR repeat protein